MMTQSELDDVREQADALLDLLVDISKRQRNSEAAPSTLNEIYHKLLGISGRLNAIVIEQDEMYNEMEKGKGGKARKWQNPFPKGHDAVFDTAEEARKEAKRIHGASGVASYNRDTGKWSIGVGRRARNPNEKPESSEEAEFFSNNPGIEKEALRRLERGVASTHHKRQYGAAEVLREMRAIRAAGLRYNS